MSKKLRAGDVLVGTCKEDKSKKDLFVIVDSETEEDCFDVVCLTRKAGWLRVDGRWANEFFKGDIRTAKELSEDEGLVEPYCCYKFKRVKRLFIKNIQAICSTVSEREEEE